MKLVRVKVDIGGTHGDEAWTSMRHFEEVEPRQQVFRLFCGHEPHEQHPPGEWGEATLKFEDFVAEYALAHYMKQRRVLDVTTEPESSA